MAESGQYKINLPPVVPVGFPDLFGQEAANPTIA